MEEARDFVGNTIVVGDTIVYMDTWYKRFTLGIIEKITPQKVRIISFGKKKTTYRLHDQVVKVEVLA